MGHEPRLRDFSLVFFLDFKPLYNVEVCPEHGEQMR